MKNQKFGYILYITVQYSCTLAFDVVISQGIHISLELDCSFVGRIPPSFFLLLLFLRFYLFWPERKRERELESELQQGGGAEGEANAGLGPRTLGS